MNLLASDRLLYSDYNNHCNDVNALQATPTHKNLLYIFEILCRQPRLVIKSCSNLALYCILY